MEFVYFNRQIKYMRYTELLIFLIALFSGCSKNIPEIQVYTAMISTVDQQKLKGWGCCPLWIGNLDVSTQPLTVQATFHMGASMIRLSELAEVGDINGNINETVADELCRAIQITALNGLPYVLSNWSPPVCMKTLAVDGSISNDTLVYLQTSNEQTFCNFIVKLFDYISKTKGFPLPAAYSLQNEPRCETPWQGCIYEPVQYMRVAKLMRTTLDSAGYSNVMMLGPEDGYYTSSSDVSGNFGFLGGAGFPFLKDNIFNKAIGAIASHSYEWPPYTLNSEFDEWISACDTWGKDRWQTEYCYIEDTIRPHAIGTVQRLIADLAYFKNNYWFTWSVNDGWGHNVPDALCFGDGVTYLNKKPIYYVLKKLFKSVPLGSKVRRMTSTDYDLEYSNATRMDMVAFKSDTNMVAIIVNPTSSFKKTTINGLTGSSAQVFQMATTANNTDMTLVGLRIISSGTIQSIDLLEKSITIIVTSAGK
jgi:hypothetical protein